MPRVPSNRPRSAARRRDRRVVAFVLTLAAFALGGCVSLGGKDETSPETTSVPPAAVSAGPANGTNGTNGTTGANGSAQAPTTATVDPNAAPTVPPNGVVADASTAAGTPTEVVTTTIARKGLLSPNAASRNLWDSWRDEDRERALLYADPSAVNVLFRQKWGAEISDQGCTVTSNPRLFRCTYAREESAWVVLVSGSMDDGFRISRTIAVESAEDAALAGLPSAPRPTSLDGPITDAPLGADGQPLPESVPNAAPKSSATKKKASTTKKPAASSAAAAADPSPAEGNASAGSGGQSDASGGDAGQPAEPEPQPAEGGVTPAAPPVSVVE